jgi:hypothetical protein
MDGTEPEVLGDLVARDRRSERVALAAPALGREYDYRRFCTTAWKVGNFLTHLGVRGGRPVALAADAAPEPVLSFYGAALLGAPVAFVDGECGDVRALIAPTSGLGAYEARPGRKRVAYGGAPSDPDVAYFERDVWSENPTEPPDPVTPDAALLRSVEEGGAYDHRTVLERAARVVESASLGPDDRVAIRSPPTQPGTVVAGLVAPLLAGGSILLPDDESVGDVAVGGPDAPEPARISPDDVL